MNEKRYFPALYVRDFRLFWFSQIISLSGTWMHSTAQGWLVYSLTKSPMYLGLIAFLSYLPIFLFTFLGGVVADRFNRRNILLVTQILSIIPAFLIALLTDLNIIEIWHVGILAFVFGLINSVDIPVRQSFFTELVGKDVITNAIALNSTIFNAARITGPLLAGFTIQYFGITACFYMNALSFLPVVVSLFLINQKTNKHLNQNKGIRSFSEGWRFVFGNKAIFYALIMIALFSLFAIPYINLMPVIAEGIFKKGIKGLSILMASVGFGSFLGALILAFKRDLERKDLFIPLSAIVFSVALFIIAISNVFTLTLFAMILSGWGLVTFLALCNGFIQESVSNELRGRVVSFYVFVFLGISPIGNLIVGFTADRIGTQEALLLFSTVVLLSALIFTFIFRRNFENTRY
ncbi:MAG: MFS transporter [Thermodesulfovibrionales bacterium]|nr:MFS transporter [Thermodesulfovibrionales bacterium]